MNSKIKKDDLKQRLEDLLRVVTDEGIGKIKEKYNCDDNNAYAFACGWVESELKYIIERI